MNIATILELQAYNRPDKKALIIDDKAVSYREINKRANKIGNSLISLGVAKGDRVALFLPNCREFIEVFFGALKIGAIVLPMNILYKERELDFLLNNSSAKVVVTLDENIKTIKNIKTKLPSLKQVVTIDGISTYPDIVELQKIVENADDKLIACDLDPDDTATILYTSGTTGNPKGSMLTHRNLMMNSEYYANKLGANSDWIGICLLPLSHLLSLAAGVLVLFGRGATMHVMKKFDSESAARIIAQYEVNFTFAVPTVYSMFLALGENSKIDLTSLEVCITTGSVTPIELRKKVEATFGCRTVQAYGQVESSPVITMDRNDKERKLESVGYPLPHVEIKIVNDNDEILPPREHGEICAKGHCVMKGYWDNPEGTAKTIIDGWLHTGDIGMIDEEGFLYIFDRKKDMIICGGYNIYPIEIEEVLYEYNKILEAAVVGIPDDRMGEIPKAFIVPKRGETITREEIMEYVVSRLAKYKKVRSVEIIDELPKGPTGKILRRKLRERL